MPRHHITISEALDKQISAYATEHGLTVAQAIPEILALYFGIDEAQDHTHGGKRKGAGRKPASDKQE